MTKRLKYESLEQFRQKVYKCKVVCLLILPYPVIFLISEIVVLVLRTNFSFICIQQKDSMVASDIQHKKCSAFQAKRVGCDKSLQQKEQKSKDSEFQLRSNFQQHSTHIRAQNCICLLYTSPSPRDLSTSRMPSSA